jgi:hypothetical protein
MLPNTANMVLCEAEQPIRANQIDAIVSPDRRDQRLLMIGPTLDVLE